MLPFTASCKPAPHASWFCIKMRADQAHIRRDKGEPIYSFDRAAHPRLSGQQISRHRTRRALKAAARAGRAATTASHKDPAKGQRICGPFFRQHWRPVAPLGKRGARSGPSLQHASDRRSPKETTAALGNEHAAPSHLSNEIPR